MNSKLTFDFTVDKAAKTVHVAREFAAERALIWDAFTKPELLDQWWGPKPWVAKTKSMEFKVGGRRLYAMCGPEGEEHWALQEFTSISPITNFQFFDAFCDKDGNISKELSSSDWNLDFTARNSSTLVDISIKHQSLSDLEQIIQMGFQEGFTIAMNGLDELLLTWKR